MTLCADFFCFLHQLICLFDWVNPDESIIYVNVSPYENCCHRILFFIFAGQISEPIICPVWRRWYSKDMHSHPIFFGLLLVSPFSHQKNLKKSLSLGLAWKQCNILSMSQVRAMRCSQNRRSSSGSALIRSGPVRRWLFNDVSLNLAEQSNTTLFSQDFLHGIFHGEECIMYCCHLVCHKLPLYLLH